MKTTNPRGKKTCRRHMSIRQCLWVGTAGVTVTTQAIRRVGAIRPNPAGFVCENRKAHPDIHVESQGTPNGLNDLEIKKKKTGGLALPDSETRCEAAVAETVWSWHEDRHGAPGMEHAPRTRPPECGPMTSTRSRDHATGASQQTGQGEDAGPSPSTAHTSQLQMGQGLKRRI